MTRRTVILFFSIYFPYPMFPTMSSNSEIPLACQSKAPLTQRSRSPTDKSIILNSHVNYLSITRTCISERTTPSIPFLNTRPVELSAACQLPPDDSPIRSPLLLSDGPTTQITRTASQLDNLSINDTGSGSSGGSLYSPETGQSPLSISSSGHLTPPSFQTDDGNPPSRSRRKNSFSLSMVPIPKSAKTMGHGRVLHSTKRGHRSAKSRSYEYRPRLYVPGCPVAPTALKGQKELCRACRGHTGTFRTRQFSRGKAKMYRRMMLPVVSRRWSSVESGTHQICLTSTLLARSAASEPMSPNLSQRSRSSTFTRGSLDHNIAPTIQEKLALRKVGPKPLRTPTITTLHRASEGNGDSEASNIADTMASTNGPHIGSACSRSQAHDRCPSECPVTRKGIDSITEPTGTNMERNSRPHKCLGAHFSINISSTAKVTRALTFTRKGLVPKTASPVKTTITVAEVQTTTATRKYYVNDLQVVSTAERSAKALSLAPCESTAHEVIWKPGDPPQSTTYMIEEGKALNNSSSSTNSETAPGKPLFESPESGKEDGLDSKNETASIHRWSWSMSQKNIPMTINSSSLDSNGLTPSS